MSMHLIRGVTVTHKSKTKKKPGWRQAEAEHRAWLLKMGIDPDAKKPRKREFVPMTSNPSGYVRETKHIPSRGDGIGVALKKESQKYTGTLIKGIATMHKSNAVPVINREQAVEISNMRRG